MAVMAALGVAVDGGKGLPSAWLPGLALKPGAAPGEVWVPGDKARPVSSDSTSHAYALICRVTGHLSLCCLIQTLQPLV